MLGLMEKRVKVSLLRICEYVFFHRDYQEYVVLGGVYKKLSWIMGQGVKKQRIVFYPSFNAC